MGIFTISTDSNSRPDYSISFPVQSMLIHLKANTEAIAVLPEKTGKVFFSKSIAGDLIVSPNTITIPAVGLSNTSNVFINIPFIVTDKLKQLHLYSPVDLLVCLSYYSLR